MPALIQSVGASPGGGFSTNRSTRPSSSVGTTPKADGSSTRVRAIVASASRSSWNRTRAVTSRSVRTSPLQTRNRLVTPPASAAKRMAPAVPSGSGSAATWSGRSENDRPAKASDRYPSDSTTSVTPWPASQLSWCSRNGRLTIGSSGLGVVQVRGRSRVPSPPASTTAFI